MFSAAIIPHLLSSLKASPDFGLMNVLQLWPEIGKKLISAIRKEYELEALTHILCAFRVR